MTNRLQRKWEIFPGRNLFYCNGRIVMAQKAGIFYLTVALIVITSALFFGFDCPYLAEHVSPTIPAVGELKINYLQWLQENWTFWQFMI